MLGSSAAIAVAACTACGCHRRAVDEVRADAPSRSVSAAASPAATATPTTATGAQPPAVGESIVHVVDVGTGLAVFVEGTDFTLLYDGGSNDDLRDDRTNRLTAYLRAVRPGLRRIDHVVLSHAHRDHVELLADVLHEYSVGEVWEPGVLEKVCAYRRFVQAIAAQPSTKYHVAAQPAGTQQVVFPKSSCRGPSELNVTYASKLLEGTQVNLGQTASMRFLHVDGTRRANINENTLVVRLLFGDTSLLLMGDAEAGKRDSADVHPLSASTEGALLARHEKELKSDVLVVGHHGSKTSTRRLFLDAVAPKLSIVSSGPHEYSGHTLPDAEVVALLAERGPVFRTDFDDKACASSPAKIGRDADGRPGGCDNIRITFRQGSQPRGEYWRGHD